jgi:hypothetical protein
LGGSATYSEDQNAAEDSGRHDEDSAGEEDEEFEFLAPGEPRFEEHLWMLDGSICGGRGRTGVGMVIRYTSVATFSVTVM